MRTVTILAGLLVVVGCAAPSKEAAILKAAIGDPSDRAASLFPADAAVLSDEEVGRILGREPLLPPRVELVVLRVGQRSPFLGWSDEFARLESDTRDGLLRTLRGAARVAGARELPSLLVPPTPTVGHLREAAARFRSDAILAWRADCRLYTRFKLFGADQSKARCDVEAALVDVRTGLVPFAASASRDFATTQQDGELTAAEAARRAEVKATAEALQEVARGLAAFLDAPAQAAR